MQNAGQQYGQGGASSHPGAPYGQTESSSNSGSITSSLRQFRKKDVDKQQLNDTNTPVTESHVARVAPHNHYPPRQTECYRYPSQFQDYSLPSQVKYSEISDPQPLQEHLPPTVIQKAKGKDYMDMCNVQQPNMKQPYSDHLNGQQSYPPEANIHAHAQYLQKDPQVHPPPYKPESQYFPKEPQYQQLPQHQIQKYNMPAQMRKCPPENDFLSKLHRIHPTMARSIMSDHHLQESQRSYQPMEQNRMYHHQNQRYMNYPSSIQGNPYPPSYMPPQHYTNYPSSCSYTRPPQMGPRFPSINNHERSLSPRRGYADNLPIPPINYTALPQKISPNYSQYNSPEYAQHYQHRRPALPPQEYYQQHCRTTQYLPHQMPSQEMSENRVIVSDSIKQYIENWADEETASEMNQMETSGLCKENFRVREDQSTETVYMINASELQYLENGIPLVTSENGIPLVASDNGQYIIKSGVAIDNSTGMVRIVDKSNHLESTESNVDRVVNLHIMDPLKPDCMLASKSNELNQKQDDVLYSTGDKPKVVIHQNTVIQPGKHMSKEPDETGIGPPQIHNKIGNSLPLITDSEASLLAKFDETIFKECKRETVDKNCSPINVEQMEKYDEFQESNSCHATVICPTKLLAPMEHLNKEVEEPSENSDDLKLKNMPVLTEEVHNTVEDHTCEAEKLASDAATESGLEAKDEENIRQLENSEEKIVEDVGHTNEDVKSDVGATGGEKTFADGEIMDTIENNTDTDTSKNEDDEMEKDVEGETEERSSIVEEAPQPTEDSKQEFNEKEELSETKVRKPQIESLSAPEVAENEVEEAEKLVDKESDAISKGENKETVASQDTVTTENNNGNNGDLITSSDHINLEKNANSSNSNTITNLASEHIIKPTTKRSRRIFSVDDIINNIGNKSKAEKERAERRRSLQMTREFLEKEIDHSYTFLQKLEAKEIVIKEFRALSEEEAKEDIPENTEKIEVNDKQLTEEAIKNCPAKETTSVKQSTEVDESVEEASVGICSVKSANDVDESIDEDRNHSEREETDSKDDCKKPPVENTSDELFSNKNSPEVISELEIPQHINEESIRDDSEAGSVLSFKQTEVEIVSQNEVHYRNAIRIEENNVLLQIAGELVEINVNSVNGKKVITVVPLSESTIVDFNDNYELLEHLEVDDPLKTDAVVETGTAMEITEIEEVVPQPDIIETTSEIIIGMDISLEEEIQLDLEKPPVLCTKAAKKAYENDLQIPSITTSEDVNDGKKAESYSPNDKVSSSKEQSPKDKSDKKKSVKTDSSKKKDVVVKRPKCQSDKEIDPEKKALRELMRVRKLKKEKLIQKSPEEEEEFVPFKDLVKARKLKKLKLQQSKGSENVSADSTNKVDQEENTESVKKSDTKDEGEKDIKNVKSREKDAAPKSKEHKPKTSSKPPKTDTGKDEITEAPKSSKDETKVENKKPKSKPKEENNVNSSTVEKADVTDKVKDKAAKKVTFGPVNFYEQQKAETPCTEIRNFVLQDPRIKSKPNGDIIVPSVSEILKENERLDSKKRLSLEEYNKRKRKLSINSDGGDREAKFRKITSEEDLSEHSRLISSEHSKVRQTEEPRSLQEKADRIKMPRPKSLDDLKIPARPRDNLTKRKLSLEVTGYKPNYFDWEETQSPKTNLHSRENNDKHLSEFSGLINNNKAINVIDINDLNAKPTPSDNSEDEILQNYKEQVDSKLSSLNIQIPRAAKLPTNVFNPFSKPETNNLMQRFLQNEKITYEEMERIKKIISYKRLVQQLKKIKSPDLAGSPLSPSYEIRKNCAEKEMKLHLKKVPGKKSKQRFRNLYSESTTESDSDLSDAKKNNAGDYSVVQSNCFAAGVPKLIIKRKTEMPVPVVRLERLDLGLLVNKKRKIY